MKRTLNASETSIQSSYIAWLNLQYPLVADVTASFANGGKRDARYGARLKKEGLKKGFPDVGVFSPRGQYGALFIEFKSKDGAIRKEQSIVMKNLVNQGYRCEVCRSFEEAMDVTNNYLNIR